MRLQEIFNFNYPIFFTVTVMLILKLTDEILYNAK